METKNIVKGILGVGLIGYTASSFFIGGKLYNDCQKRMERMNPQIELVNRLDFRTLSEKSKEAFENDKKEYNHYNNLVNKIRGSVIYYPFGKLYDWAEDRS